MVQLLAWRISLMLIAALALAFLFVLAHSRQLADYTAIRHDGYRLRDRLFLGALALSAMVLTMTSNGLPYAATHAPGGPAQVVQVVGHQWYWTISPTTVTTGAPVEFRVTSADVNHSFALYSPALQLLAETQAMPNYTNRLRYTFDQPGVYRVMCLEYCGLGHTAMNVELQVQAGGKPHAS
ncbi:MAG TPA: hypothetical protein V6D47_20530 [Oscillatoriaceae cyanobacterium]